MPLYTCANCAAEKYLSLISTGSSPVSEAERLLKTIKTHFAPVSASTYAGMLRIAARANNIEFAIALWAVSSAVCPQLD